MIGTATNPLTPPVKTGASSQGDPYSMSAGLLGGAADVYSNIAQGGALQNINAYLNPYYESVIDSTFNRMDINRDKTLGSIGDAAERAGAFGGVRHGLLEGEFLGQDQLNRAQMASNLMAQGFDQAQMAARSDLFNAAGGASQLGNQYFNIGNNIADRQMQSGTWQQQFMQSLLSGAEGRYDQAMNHPYKILDLLNAINQGDPRIGNVTGTQTTTPGLFDYLALAAGVGGAALGG